MKDEKMKDLRENEIDDDTLDEVAGGAGAGETACYLCSKPFPRLEMKRLFLDGKLRFVCENCAPDYYR